MLPAILTEMSLFLKVDKATNPMVITNLPDEGMHHDGPGVVEVLYNGSPGLISKLHDRYAPVSRVSPVEVL